MTNRIAVVTHSQYPVEVRARRMAEALAARGDSVEVFCLRKPGESDLEVLNGVTIHRLPMFRSQGGGAKAYISEYLRFATAAGALMCGRAGRRFDLIQVHNPPDFLAFSTLAPRLFGRARILFDVRDVAPELFMSRFRSGPNHPMIRLLYLAERLACSYAHAVTVCTTYTFDALVARGIPAKKMHIVMNLPDDRIFGEVRCCPDDAGFRVAYHGGVLERYGPDLIVRAVPQLKAAIPGLHVDIFGAGDFLPALANLVGEMSLSETVTLHGFVRTDDIPALISRAHVGVVPMRQDLFTDGLLPTKLMELAAIGVPAVAARTKTTVRYFDDSMVSYFTPGDVNEMADRIIDIYREPERGHRIASNARAFARRHNWPAEKLRYLSLIDSLIRGTQ